MRNVGMSLVGSSARAARKAVNMMMTKKKRERQKNELSEEVAHLREKADRANNQTPTNKNDSCAT